MNNNSKTKPLPLIGGDVTFVKKEDLQRISEFESEMLRLGKHVEFFSTEKLRLRFRDSANAYQTSPSDENLAELKRLGIEYGAFTLESAVGYQPKAVVRDVFKKYINQNVYPFIKDLLGRGLEKARSQLHAVAEKERARHLELTGEQLGESSTPLIAAANRPVAELEALLKENDGSMMATSPGYFLKLFATLRARFVE